MTEREQQLEEDIAKLKAKSIEQLERYTTTLSALVKAGDRISQLEALLREAREILYRARWLEVVERIDAALAKPAPNAAPQEAEGGRAAILPAVTQEAPAVAAPQESSEAVRLARETIVLGDEEGNTLLGECLRGTTAYTLAREVLRLHERGKDHS